MADSATQIDQVRRLQAAAQKAATDRATAMANRDAAAANLQTILDTHGVATMDELSAKAQAASLQAAQLIEQAAHDLGVTL